MRIAVVPVLLALVAFARADDPTESLPGVVDITPDNVDQYINGGKHVLAEFYAPWCGHCKRMVNDYKALGEAITADPSLSSRVTIVKVNADEHKELGTRFGVSGFPTIKWFSRGQPIDKPEDYRGGRTTDEFLAFISEKLQADKGYARVEALDELVAKFVAAGADAKAVLAELEGAVAKLGEDTKANGELYVKLAKKAVEKGQSYFSTELARLERMVAKGSTAQAKVEEMLKKISVLSAYTAGTEAKEE